MPDRITGRHLHVAFKRQEWVQGVQAPQGVETPIPLILADRPHTRTGVRCFLGTVGGGRGRLVVLGLDFDVDLLSRRPTWLATARWPLLDTNTLTFEYFTYGYTT
jgi:hypothetical protein